jgi:hypothetical protein
VGDSSDFVAMMWTAAQQDDREGNIEERWHDEMKLRGARILGVLGVLAIF